MNSEEDDEDDCPLNEETGDVSNEVVGVAVHVEAPCRCHVSTVTQESFNINYKVTVS